MLVAADDAVVDLTTVDESQASVLAQTACAVCVDVLTEQGQLTMLVVCYQIDAAVAGEVGEAATTAPEEGRSVVDRVGIIRDVLIHGSPSDGAACVVAVFVAVDDQLLPRAEGRRPPRADVSVPEDAVGLVRQHQVR